MKRYGRGTTMISVGNFPVAPHVFFDVRCCDGGVMLSLCHEKQNKRYTVIIDNGTVVFQETAKYDTERRSKGTK
jgi:hypothetical protein